MPEQTISLKLRVDDSGSVVLDRFSGKLEKIPQHIGSMNNALSLIKWDSIINLGRQVINLTQQFYQFGKGIASAANDIERQAGIVGISTTEWQKWTYAAKMADASTEGLMTGMKFLSQNIIESRKEGSEASNIFKTLGITGEDLRGVLYQLADRFSKSADGADKITYATKLFGRGAMELIPLLNQGSEGIKKYGEEAVKLGTVLGDVVVKKGSEAEDMFKKLDAQVNASKLSLVPLVLEFAKLAESIMKSVNAYRKWNEERERGREPTSYTDYMGGPAALNKPRWGESESIPIGPRLEVAKGKLPPIAEGKKGIWSDYGISEEEYNRIKDSHERLNRDTKEWIQEYNEIWTAPEGFEWVDQISDETKKVIKDFEEMREAISAPRILKDSGIKITDIFDPADLVDNDALDLAIEGLKTKLEWVLKPTSDTLQKMGEDFAKAKYGKYSAFDWSPEDITMEGYAFIGGQAYKLDDLYKYKSINDEMQMKYLSEKVGDIGGVPDIGYGAASEMGRSAAREVRFDKIAEDQKKVDYWNKQISAGFMDIAGSFMHLDQGWKGFLQSFLNGISRIIQQIMAAKMETVDWMAMLSKAGGAIGGMFGGGGSSGSSGSTPSPGAGGGWGDYEPNFRGGGGGGKPGGSEGRGGGLYIGNYTNIERIEATDVDSFQRKYSGAIRSVGKEKRRKQTSWRDS